MKKLYSAPLVRTEPVQFGVYGEYGQNSEIGNPVPIKIIDTFEFED